VKSFTNARALSKRVEICEKFCNTKPKFIYFEPMFLGLWLMVVLE